MIRDFLIKKENIFIGIVAIVCIFFVILGFLFLFLRAEPDTRPRTIPNNTDEIVWSSFKSDLIKKKIQYPEYMYLSEQIEEDGTGITLVEFKPAKYLTYYSNQSHVSIYPQGSETPFFYAKTRESKYVSKTGEEFDQTEFLTSDNNVWAVKLVPSVTPVNWQPWGFILIQSKIYQKEQGCYTENGVFEKMIECDPYLGQKIVYTGEPTQSFIDIGYAIIDKNNFN